MLFQTTMMFCSLRNTKDDILKNVGNQTVLVTIENLKKRSKKFYVMGTVDLWVGLLYDRGTEYTVCTMKKPFCL